MAPVYKRKCAEHWRRLGDVGLIGWILLINIGFYVTFFHAHAFQFSRLLGFLNTLLNLW